MQRVKILALRSQRRRSGKDERGVALITTLLLLMLLTGLTLTMAWSARSDMLINGYYRNFRGAFYAADSGLNVVRQAAINQFTPGAGLPATFTAGAAPIPAGTEAAIAAAINASYAGFTPITGSGQGQAANSWPGQFKLPTANSFQLSPVSCTVIGTPAPAPGKPAWSCTNLPPNTTQFTYIYNYAITVQGQSKGGENATLFDRGQITLVANVVNASSKTSFAAWGMFIDNSTICDGSTSCSRHNLRSRVHQRLLELWHRQVHLHRQGWKRGRQRGISERRLSAGGRPFRQRHFADVPEGSGSGATGGSSAHQRL